MSIESVMPSNHLILCSPLLLLPSIFPNIRVFSDESALHIRWPKYWSFSFDISPSQTVDTKIRLIIFFAAKDGEAVYSQQKQDQELTVADHELIIAKFRLKLKKVGETTRPFTYDLNQTPYDYTVEVTNRFKGLELIECLMN